MRKSIKCIKVWSECVDAWWIGWVGAHRCSNRKKCSSQGEWPAQRPGMKHLCEAGVGLAWLQNNEGQNGWKVRPATTQFYKELILCCAEEFELQQRIKERILAKEKVIRFVCWGFFSFWKVTTSTENVLYAKHLLSVWFGSVCLFFNKTLWGKCHYDAHLTNRRKLRPSEVKWPTRDHTAGK